MAITTVVDFWQQEVDVYTTEKTAAQADLTAAQTGVATAKQQRDADVAALAANRTGIAAKRAKLANSKIPTETEALTTEIRDLIEQQRLLQGTILDDQDQLDWWQASLDVASAGVERVSARLSDATTQLKQAKDDRKARSDLTTALAQAPFANLKGDATTFLGGGVVTDATTQLQGTDFPSPLFDRAQKRHQTRTLHVASLGNGVALALGKLGDTAAADAGLDGVAEKAQQAFAAAAQAVRRYAASAKLRYDTAVGVMTALAAIKANPNTDFLTPAERNLVKPDAARTAAEGDVAQIDTDRRAVDTARETLEAQILTQIAANVDALPTDATVAANRAAVATARGKVTTSINTFLGKGTEPKDLADWGALYQDDEWQRLLDYFDAKAALTELAGIIPTGAGSIAAAMDTAETAYAVALAAGALARRRRDALNDEITLRGERYDAATAVASGRLLSAIRGDSY